MQSTNRGSPCVLLAAFLQLLNAMRAVGIMPQLLQKKLLVRSVASTNYHLLTFASLDVKSKSASKMNWPRRA